MQNILTLLATTLLLSSHPTFAGEALRAISTPEQYLDWLNGDGPDLWVSEIFSNSDEVLRSARLKFERFQEDLKNFHRNAIATSLQGWGSAPARGVPLDFAKTRIAPRLSSHVDRLIYPLGGADFAMPLAFGSATYDIVDANPFWGRPGRCPHFYLDNLLQRSDFTLENLLTFLNEQGRDSLTDYYRGATGQLVHETEEFGIYPVAYLGLLRLRLVANASAIRVERVADHFEVHFVLPTSRSHTLRYWNVNLSSHGIWGENPPSEVEQKFYDANRDCEENILVLLKASTDFVYKNPWLWYKLPPNTPVISDHIPGNGPFQDPGYFSVDLGRPFGYGTKLELHSVNDLSVSAKENLELEAISGL